MFFYYKQNRYPTQDCKVIYSVRTLYFDYKTLSKLLYLVRCEIKVSFIPKILSPRVYNLSWAMYTYIVTSRRVSGLKSEHKWCYTSFIPISSPNRSDNRILFRHKRSIFHSSDSLDISFLDKPSRSIHDTYRVSFFIYNLFGYFDIVNIRIHTKKSSEYRKPRTLTFFSVSLI